MGLISSGDWTDGQGYISQVKISRERAGLKKPFTKGLMGAAELGSPFVTQWLGAPIQQQKVKIPQAMLLNLANNLETDSRLQ